MEAILEVNNISIEFKNKKRSLKAVEDVSFSVMPGEVLGIVGESGCGKSLTSLAIMGLLPAGAAVPAGEILFKNNDILKYTEKELCKIRGNEISMIFQDPMTAMNPTTSIGNQLIEPFMIHQKCSKKMAWNKAIEMLHKVGIASPVQRMKEYPHQMSGGMLQRVVIASALACRPEMLIADEPTTALDVTIQAQILDLIRTLSRENGTAVILITHDMGVVAEMADHVLVLYAGQTVEYGKTKEVFMEPQHPYTKALLKAIPAIDSEEGSLESIPGVVPELADMPDYCRFAPRCDEVMERCQKTAPQMLAYGGRSVRCLKYKEG